jgi:hypothetical protein
MTTKNKAKLEIGTTVRVLRSKRKGTVGTIVRETASYYFVKPAKENRRFIDHFGTFQVAKSNVVAVVQPTSSEQQAIQVALSRHAETSLSEYVACLILQTAESHQRSPKHVLDECVANISTAMDQLQKQYGKLNHA